MLGFQIDNRLKELTKNYEKCYRKVHKIGRRWARYRLSLKGRITIAKTLLLPQFMYVATVLHTNDRTYDKIDKIIRSFINTGSTLTPGKRKWNLKKDYVNRKQRHTSQVDIRENKTR